MYERERDGRREVAVTDIEALVPENHLVRKIEKVMDYEWIYERVAPYYSAAKNVRPGTDPVVLVKMVLLQHLFGIPSLRQTYQRACDTISYRWFLGYGLLDKLPHFATVSYAFCRRFPEELATEIFEHILNKALNNHMVDSSMVFIDGTHIKASANKKKYQKEQVAKAARVYAKRLREEVNEERMKLGKAPVEEEDEDDDSHGDGGTTEQVVSTTDPECGMYHKGEHEKQFAYEAHTVCDRHGMVLGVKVTAGNVHDSVAWDSVYEQVTSRFPEIQYVTMDAGYKQPWIAKRILEDGRLPILPYTRPHGTRREGFMPWDFSYDEKKRPADLPTGASSPAYHHQQRGQTAIPQHPEGLPGLSLPKGVRGQCQWAEGDISSHLAGSIGFSGATAQNPIGERHLRHAQANHRARFCRCERQTRHALYSPQRLGPRYAMGHA